MEDESNRHAILIVDDDRSVLNALRRLLSDEGHEIYTADSYDETIQLLSEQTFAVVITDFKMPDICGDDLLSIVKAKSPHTRRIMLSGTADTSMVPEPIADSILHCQVFLSKPWDDEKLLATVRMCVKEYEASQKAHPVSN